MFKILSRNTEWVITGVVHHRKIPVVIHKSIWLRARHTCRDCFGYGDEHLGSLKRGNISTTWATIPVSKLRREISEPWTYFHGVGVTMFQYYIYCIQTTCTRLFLWWRYVMCIRMITAAKPLWWSLKLLDVFSTNKCIWRQLTQVWCSIEKSTFIL